MSHMQTEEEIEEELMEAFKVFDKNNDGKVDTQGNTLSPLYTDIRYNDNSRYTDSLNAKNEKAHER